MRRQISLKPENNPCPACENVINQCRRNEKLEMSTKLKITTLSVYLDAARRQSIILFRHGNEKLNVAGVVKLVG